MGKLVNIILVVVIALAILMVGLKTFSNEDDWLCVNGEWVKHGNPSSPKPIAFCEKSCALDSDCETPGEFLMQSNCPFDSACVNGQCRVICPIFESECFSDEDCDCFPRGERSIDCLCLEGECVSVEA
jgi:hypothetical protein